MPVIKRNTGSVLLNGLSSFWKRFFKDTVVLDTLYSATETILGDVYLELMEAVLSKSIRSTPIYNKRDWQLLVLSNTQLSFDPPVYSSAKTSSLGPDVTVTAQDLSAQRDSVVMELTDSFNLTAEKKVLYPTYGIYNVGLVSGVIDHEQLWVLVVPSGQSIFSSISALNRRAVSNKRITNFTFVSKPSIQNLPISTKKKLGTLGSWDASTNTPPVPASTPLTEGQYYEVAVAGSTPIDGISAWAVGDLLVSRGDVWVKAPLEDPKITFRYGKDLIPEITIPPGNYTDINGVRTAVQAAINAMSLTLSSPLNITVSVDGGYLLFSSDKDLLVWDTNTAFDTQLYLRPFRFKATALIPPGREDEFMWNQTGPLQLLTAGFAQAGTEYRFPVRTDLRAAKYIYNALYQPSLVLEEQRNYRISGGFIYFKDNPFDFNDVAFRDFGDGRRELALWMSKVSIDRLTLFINYGYRFTKLKESSEAYKAFIEGIYYYYTHGPQLERLKSAFNILAGIPVAADNDETVLTVAPNRLSMTTDKNSYEFEPNTPTSVEVGDVLQAFDALTNVFKVEDYVSNPTWFDRMVIPDFLMPEAPLSFRVSSVSTFIPLIGDPGFIVGETTTDALELFTNPITPALNDYSILAVAFFIIERDNNGKNFNVVVPPALTTGAVSLSDMVNYLRIASKQLLGNPVQGAGVNPFRLLTNAVFSIIWQDITYEVTITPGHTAAVASLADLVSVVQTRIDAAMGPGQIQVYPFLTTNSLVLMPTSNLSFEVANLNVSAATELGLYPFESLAGITITAVDNTIRFASTTIGASSRIKISGMNSQALDSFAMDTFRQGSGDIIGDDGDPTPGWDIMDKYLKFNTFRIRYDANTVRFDDDTISVQEIVQTGRPLYTSALIAPEFALFEVVVGSTDGTVPDVDAYKASLDPDDILLADILAKKKATVYASQPYGQLYRKDPVVPYDYIQLASVKAVDTLSGVSTEGGKLAVASIDNGLTKVDQIVEVTDIDSLKLADADAFSEPGIYNRGLIVNGVEIPVSLIPSGTLGGIYPAYATGISPHGHWVEGFDKADFPAAATHVLVIDDAMKLAGFNPYTQGVVAGNFLTLRNMGDVNNDGEFAILKLYRNVHYRNLYSGPNKVLVDILVYRNTRALTTTSENWAENSVPPGATIRFRAGGSKMNNHWLVILPAAGTVTQRILDLALATTDHQALFPFTLTYVPALAEPGTWVSPPANTYYEAETYDGDQVNETFYGSFFKVSWDTNVAHDDIQAQNIGSLPHGHTVDTKSIVITRGSTTWGRETWDYDADPVGAVSRTPGVLANPYLLGQDGAGVNVYADYDAASKLGTNVTAVGEVTFFKGIKYHFDNQAPTDKAEYFGPHPTYVAPVSPGVWPAGNTSTYRSFNWKGYWLARFNMLGNIVQTNPYQNVIGGGSLPGVSAPPGYTIGLANTLFTLQIGGTLSAIPGSSLPAPSNEENDLYTVLLSGNTPVPNVTAPVEAGYQLFEHQDWIFSNGVTWTRKRHTGTSSEVNVFNLGRRIIKQVNTGVYTSWPYAGLIGGGFILLNHHNHNYQIGVDGSSWTKVIGGRVLGNFQVGGWYDFLGPNKYAGYGPDLLDEHTYVTNNPAHTEASATYDWSTDTSLPGPHYPFFRVAEPGGSEFVLYAQVPESALEQGGLTFVTAPGFSLMAVPDAIRILYYDGATLNWSTPSLGQIDGSLVTGTDFTLKVVALSGGRHRLRLWNTQRLDAHGRFFEAESGNIDPALYSIRHQGKVVIALQISYGGTFSSITDYLKGVVIERSRVNVVAA